MSHTGSGSRAKTFNALPLEIIKMVFCSIDSEDLFDLKFVCSYWRNIIQELLKIQMLKVTDERVEDAINIFDCDHCNLNPFGSNSSFSIHRSRFIIKNIISKPVLGSVLGKCTIDSIVEDGYAETYNTLLFNAESHGVKCNLRFDEPLDCTWRTILALTETQYTIEELTDKIFGDKAVESCMTAYKWYRVISDEYYAGHVVLFPDNKTFSVIFSPPDYNYM